MEKCCIIYFTGDDIESGDSFFVEIVNSYYLNTDNYDASKSYLFCVLNVEKLAYYGLIYRHYMVGKVKIFES